VTDNLEFGISLQQRTQEATEGLKVIDDEDLALNHGLTNPVHTAGTMEAFDDARARKSRRYFSGLNRIK
jgi:hypothetical protein